MCRANAESLVSHMSPTSSPQERHPQPVSIPPELRLVSRVHRLSHHLERPFLQKVSEQHNISLPEWRVLVQVVQQPGIVSSEVAFLLGLPAMAVSRAVQALRDSQRMTTQVDPADSRRRQLFATQQGHDLYTQLAPQAVADLTEMMSVLNQDEFTFFMALIERLNRYSDDLS